jgi:hypothetical protein
MKDLIDLYLTGTREFSAMLEERSEGEAAYDGAVTAALRKGLSIEEALQVAAEKCPQETLRPTDETIKDIKAYYEYLKDHENILAKLSETSGAE